MQGFKPVIKRDESYKDFTLPGLIGRPSKAERLSLGLTQSYSTRWNHQRLESNFYAPWNTVLNALFRDLEPYADVMPQYTFTTMDDGAANPPSSRDSLFRTNEREEKKAKAKAKKAAKAKAAKEKEEALAETDEGVGGKTVTGDEPDDEAEEPENEPDKSGDGSDTSEGDPEENYQPRSASRTPDYVMMLYQRWKLRSATDPSPQAPVPTTRDGTNNVPNPILPHFTKWDEIKLECAVIPSLWENKRPPSRFLTADAFPSILASKLQAANEALEIQSILAFVTQKNLKELILVGTAGEWWFWRLKTRPEENILKDRLREIQDGDFNNLRIPGPAPEFQGPIPQIEEKPVDKRQLQREEGQSFTGRRAAGQELRQQPERAAKNKPTLVQDDSFELTPYDFICTMPTIKRLTVPQRHLVHPRQQGMMPNLGTLLNRVRETPAYRPSCLRFGTPESNQSMALILSLHEDHLIKIPDGPVERSPPSSPRPGSMTRGRQAREEELYGRSHITSSDLQRL